MKKIIVMGYLVACVLFQTAFSQTITLEDFLDSVHADHPFFKREALSSNIEQMNRTRFLGNQDWIVSSTPFLRHQEPLETNPFVPKTIDSFGFAVGADRTFWKTGGRLSLSWSTDFTDQETRDIIIPGIVTIPSGPARFYQHGIFATYSHPLLKNRGGRLDRLGYEVTGYAVNATELNSLENRENFLLDIGLRFIDWVLFTEQIRIAEERLRLAEEQLNQVERRFKANLVDKVDVLRSEDAVRIAKQNILLLESLWKAKRAELATISQNGRIYDYKPVFDLYATKMLMPVDEAVSKLMNDTRSIRSLDLIGEQLVHQRKGFKNATRPQLDVSVSAGLIEGDNSFGESLTLEKPDFTLGVQLIYPLGNRSAEADVEKIDLQIRQLENDIRNTRLELESAARNLYIQTQEMEKVLALNREQIESAGRKTDEEIKLYNQGRSQLTFVIQSRDNEENSKLIYADNAALYHKLLLQYAALMDELLPEDSANAQ
jgi:outer membrane protein TolC